MNLRYKYFHIEKMLSETALSDIEEFIKQPLHLPATSTAFKKQIAILNDFAKSVKATNHKKKNQILRNATS